MRDRGPRRPNVLSIKIHPLPLPLMPAASPRPGSLQNRPSTDDAPRSRRRPGSPLVVKVAACVLYANAHGWTVGV